MNEVETIDVTPTWTALVPMMIAILTTVKNPKTIKELTAELLKMAEGADRWIAHVKELKEKEEAK
jgi:hypothetical protein